MNEREEHRFFKRTRDVYRQIENARNHSIDERDDGRSESDGGRLRRNKRDKTKRIFQQNPRGSEKFPRKRKPGKNYSFGNVPIVSHESLKSRFFQHPSKKIVNQYRQQLQNNQGLINNFDNSMEFPSIRPPAIGTGVDMHGSYTELLGTEALFPIKVRPKSVPNIADGSFTEIGDVIAMLPISPDFMSNTRLRLLLANYQRWKPVRISITFQPLGNATLSGGLVAVPVTDPDAQLSLSGDQEFIVSRAMDFEGAENFNAYNEAIVEFPPLPEEEEPYFMNAGISARFETPYSFWVIAQTSFPPEDPDTELEREIHWLTLNYEVRMYDPSLPEISSDNFSVFQDFTGDVFTDVFAVQTAAINQPVRGIINAFNLGLDQREKIGIIRVTSDFLDQNLDVMVWDCDTHGDFELRKGTLIFYRRVWEPSIPGTRIGFYSTVDGAYNENDQMYWATAPSTLGNMTGSCYQTVYDLDHTL